MTRKFLVVTAALLIIFSLQAQAKSGDDTTSKVTAKHGRRGDL